MGLVFYFIFIHVSLLIPGYTLASSLKIFRKHPAATIGISYLISMLLYFLLATSYYLLNLPAFILQAAFWVVFLGSIFLFIYSKLYFKLYKEWVPLLGFVVMSSFTLCFSFITFSGSYTIIPDPEYRANRHYDTLNVKILNVAQTNANDNYIPYRQAQFFVNKSNPATDSFIDEWGVHFFQRTPFMGAVTAQYFIALSDQPPVGYTWSNDSTDTDNTYQKFQIIAQILNCLFIIPAFYLIRRLFDEKTAILSLLFIIPSQFFMYNAFFTWPKSLVAFFILLSWYLIIANKSSRFIVAAAVASGLAYLTHDLAILYIGASFIFLLVNKRFRDSLTLAGGSALFALPWLFLSSVIYHRASSFIYYPISTKDIPQPGHFREVFDTFLHTSPFRILMIRVESLFYLLSPYQLIVDEGGQAIVRRLWALGIYSLPGALGLGLVVPTLVSFFRRARTKRLWILLFMPIILCVIVIGWPRGLGALHFAQAIVVLLLGLGVSVLANARRNVWIYIAFFFNLAQLIVLTLFSYNFSIDLSSLRNVVLLSAMSIVVIALIYGVYLTNKYYKKSKKV